MTYNAIVEDTGPGGYTASILGWPDCTAKGATKDEALARLRLAIANRLSRVEIVPIEVEVPPNGHPLAKFAGVFKDDELFDQFLQDMVDYRRELDAETAE